MRSQKSKVKSEKRKAYFPKVYFQKCFSQKCIYPKCIFAKCTQLACFLSFASLLNMCSWYDYPRFFRLLWETFCDWTQFQIPDFQRKSCILIFSCYIIFMGSREKGHRFWYISAKNHSRLKVTLQSEEDSEHYTLRSLEVVKDNFLHPLQLSNLNFFNTLQSSNG